MRLGRRALIAFALLGCAAEANGDGTLDSAVTDDAVIDDAVLPEVDGAATTANAALACIADNPPSDPFDLGDVISVPSRAPGSPGPAPEPATDATVATFASHCVASGGTGCDASRFISKQAASCLAELDGFDAGLEPWKVFLDYHDGFQRVAWNVMNVTSDRGARGYSGGALTLDATTGDVLGRYAYAAVP